MFNNLPEMPRRNNQRLRAKALNRCRDNRCAVGVVLVVNEAITNARNHPHACRSILILTPPRRNTSYAPTR
jgi:hypothetical protein